MRSAPDSLVLNLSLGLDDWSCDKFCFASSSILESMKGSTLKLCNVQLFVQLSLYWN
jgi:hypothetical protein